MPFVDAHNHLQDRRLSSELDAIVESLTSGNVLASVVNGCGEGDWERVRSIAARTPIVVPCFGYHPWYVPEASPAWRENLGAFLDSVPSGIGEIGIDRWKPGLDIPRQEQVFVEQLTIAAERNIPASIHCLRAWGRLLQLLMRTPLPQCGFLLHSYGGPREMIEELVKLGAYFSCPGYFLQPGKEGKLGAFKSVPRERLLLETDAPDQVLPISWDRFRTVDPNTEKRINHPGNIDAVYEGVAQMLGVSTETLESELEENFRSLFCTVLERKKRSTSIS